MNKNNSYLEQFLKNRAYVSIMCYGESLAQNKTDLLKTQVILLISFIFFTTVILTISKLF